MVFIGSFQDVLLHASTLSGPVACYLVFLRMINPLQPAGRRYAALITLESLEGPSHHPKGTKLNLGAPPLHQIFRSRRCDGR
jgi:hypothetical protein